MSNLLEETVAEMQSLGLSADNIIFIGSEISGHACSWAEFQALANVTYDSCYGAQEVASDLIIAFDNGSRLVRSEYDGSERWDLIAPVVLPQKTLPIRSLVVHSGMVGWRTLADLNSGAAS